MPEEVVTHKVKLYYEKLKSPVFVEDNSFEIAGLSGLPGPYIRSFLEKLGYEGIAKLANSTEDNEINIISCIAFADEKGKITTFRGEMKCKMIENPRGDKCWGWGPYIIPVGQNMTLAEMEPNEMIKYHYRSKAAKVFCDWLLKEI